MRDIPTDLAAEGPSAMLNGLFGLGFRMNEIDDGGDPLIRLNAAIDWERKSNAGRRPFDAVMMFKILILQPLYNLSGDAAEYQIRDRLRFMRFLGLTLAVRAPGAKTRCW